MRRLSALVLCLGLVFFGSPARAQYADENISYFTGAWTCGVEKLVFRPGDYQLLIAEFSLGDTVSATASFGIPTVRLLAPPVRSGRSQRRAGTGSDACETAAVLLSRISR